MPITLKYLVALVVVFVAGWLAGFAHEHQVLIQFKAEVEAQGKIAEQVAQETEKRHDAEKQEIDQDYKQRLVIINRRYADSLRNSSRGKVSKSTDATSRLNEAASNSDPYLVEQCAETTLQLVELQNWVKSVEK